MTAKQSESECAIGARLTVAYTLKKNGKKMADNIWRRG